MSTPFVPMPEPPDPVRPHEPNESDDSEAPSARPPEPGPRRMSGFVYGYPPAGPTVPARQYKDQTALR